jgi:hypothetical protein
MAEKPNKTEQGRQKRTAEKASRAAATQGRRDSAAAAQGRSEQRKGRNVDEGSASRDASFAARETNAGLTLAGNQTTSSGRGVSGPSFSEREAANGLTNTTSGRVASRATNPDFPPVGTPLGNDEFTATNNVGGGGGGGLAGIEIIWADQSIGFIEAADLTDTYDDEAYWSLVLTVSSGSFDKALAYDATADIFTTTGTAPNEVQTKYRLRLITQYTNGDGDTVSSGISAYGQYREVILCVNGSPRTSLIKVT